MSTEATTTPTAEAEESGYTWVAPAYLSVPYETVRWLVTRAWRHRIMLSPTYAALLLQGLATQGWPTWALTFGGIICLAVLYVVGRIRETPLGWQAFALGSAGASTGYLIAATELGWYNPSVLALWSALVGGATVARWKVAEHYAPAEQPPAELPSAQKLELAPPPHPLQATIDDVCQKLMALRDRIGYPGLEILQHEVVTENRFTVMVKTRTPTRSVAGDRESIAAQLELPVGMLRRITGIDGNSGVQVFHFQVGQAHGGSYFEWKPPRWADEDILEPKKVGVFEDEEDATMLLAHPEHGVYHGATAGKTGYGKTVHQQVVGAHIANCENAVLMVGDMKSALDFAPLAPAAVWYGTTAEEVTKMLVSVARLCENGPSSRGPLKRRGDRVVVPTPDSVALFFLLDEMRMVFSREMNPEFYKLANAAALTIVLLGRALGVSLHVAGQNMSEPAMPQTGDRSGTEFRAQLHHRRVFHEDKAESGQFLLDDYATLDVTQLKSPGRYFHAAGDAPSIPILGPDIPNPLKLHEWALRRSESMQGVDERTARLLGDDFATAGQRVPAELAEWLPTSRPKRRSATTHPVPGLRKRAQQAAKAMAVPASPEVRAAQDQADLEERLAALDAELDGELDGDAQADALEELANTDLANVVLELDNPTLEALAKALERGGRSGVNRVGLMDATQMKRTWLSERLNVLAKDEVLYSQGQTSAKRWFVADGVDGRRLREAIEAADEAVRSQDEQADGGDDE